LEQMPQRHCPHCRREENAFLITNAKLSDSGIYTCTALSAAGEIKVNATLVVNGKLFVSFYQDFK